MAPTAKQLRQADPRTLEIVWSDGTSTRHDVRALRLACPCAGCVDEATGERVLDPAKVPADVKPVRITGVGNYAIAVTWSDGHTTGIYSFDRLRSMAEDGAA